MNLTTKLIISIMVAAIASTATSYLGSGALFDPLMLSIFTIATVVTALLVSGKPSTHATSTHDDHHDDDDEHDDEDEHVYHDDADRELGEVKWFNVTKGFGFIVRDNGEEIFVHFRSIRGDGRRSLKDGQKVRFVVTDSDKGPQAEDVEGL
jgi:CspA family cold shock protein